MIEWEQLWKINQCWFSEKSLSRWHQWTSLWVYCCKISAKIYWVRQQNGIWWKKWRVEIFSFFFSQLSEQQRQVFCRWSWTFDNPSQCSVWKITKIHQLVKSILPKLIRKNQMHSFSTMFSSVQKKKQCPHNTVGFCFVLHYHHQRLQQHHQQNSKVQHIHLNLIKTYVSHNDTSAKNLLRTTLLLFYYKFLTQEGENLNHE